MGGGMGGGTSFSSLSGTSGSKNSGNTETYDRIVELYGIIYIFNPVDEKLLKADGGNSGMMGGGNSGMMGGGNSGMMNRGQSGRR